MIEKEEKRIKGVNFVRGVCAIGIVIFHFYCHSTFTGGFMTNNANSTWGSVFVYIFFIVSGLCMYKSNYDISIKFFYYKRWKSIFPAFYIAYFFFKIMKILYTHDFNNNDAPLWTILLTFLGLDGYLSSNIKNFYLIGEWFLGAIILIYILYPLILYLFKKNNTLFLLLLLVSSWLISKSNFFMIPIERNLICCITGFVIGMTFGKFSKILSNQNVVVVSIVLLLNFCVFPLSDVIPKIWIIMLQALTMFICLRLIGEIISFKFISSISYHIYLVQHVIIIIIFKYNNTTDFYYSLLLCIITTIIVIMTGLVLKIITNKVVSSPLFTMFNNSIGYNK